MKEAEQVREKLSGSKLNKANAAAAFKIYAAAADPYIREAVEDFLFFGLSKGETGSVAEEIPDRFFARSDIAEKLRPEDARRIFEKDSSLRLRKAFLLHSETHTPHSPMSERGLANVRAVFETRSFPPPSFASAVEFLRTTGEKCPIYVPRELISDFLAGCPDAEPVRFRDAGEMESFFHCFDPDPVTEKRILFSVLDGIDEETPESAVAFLRAVGARKRLFSAETRDKFKKTFAAVFIAAAKEADISGPVKHHLSVCLSGIVPSFFSKAEVDSDERFRSALLGVLFIAAEEASPYEKNGALIKTAAFLGLSDAELDTFVSKLVGDDPEYPAKTNMLLKFLSRAYGDSEPKEIAAETERVVSRLIAKFAARLDASEYPRKILPSDDFPYQIFNGDPVEVTDKKVLKAALLRNMPLTVLRNDADGRNVCRLNPFEEIEAHRILASGSGKVRSASSSEWSSALNGRKIPAAAYARLVAELPYASDPPGDRFDSIKTRVANISTERKIDLLRAVAETGSFDAVLTVLFPVALAFFSEGGAASRDSVSAAAVKHAILNCAAKIPGDKKASESTRARVADMLNSEKKIFGDDTFADLFFETARENTSVFVDADLEKLLEGKVRKKYAETLLGTREEPGPDIAV